METLDTVTGSANESASKTEYGLLKWTTPRVISKTEEDAKDSSCSEEEMEQESCELRELLTSLIEGKRWTEGGELWAQYVSPEPATRDDVIKLAEKLDAILTENGARETGLCDVRRKIYTELFDELIREEGVVCGERGKLMVRLRDELACTMEEYQDLYSSSTSYGLRKDIQAEEVKKKLENEIEDLRMKSEQLKAELSDLTEKYEVTEKQYADISKLNEEKHIALMEYYQENNKIVKEKLVSFLVAKKVPLHQVIEMIESGKDLTDIEITLFPPEDGVLTEEESGNESDNDLNHLPGQVLRTEVEVASKSSCIQDTLPTVSNEIDSATGQEEKQHSCAKKRAIVTRQNKTKIEKDTNPNVNSPKNSNSKNYNSNVNLNKKTFTYEKMQKRGDIFEIPRRNADYKVE